MGVPLVRREPNSGDSSLWTCRESNPGPMSVESIRDTTMPLSVMTTGPACSVAFAVILLWVLRVVLSDASVARRAYPGCPSRDPKAATVRQPPARGTGCCDRSRHSLRCQLLATALFYDTLPMSGRPNGASSHRRNLSGPRCTAQRTLDLNQDPETVGVFAYAGGLPLYLLSSSASTATVSGPVALPSRFLTVLRD